MNVYRPLLLSLLLIALAALLAPASPALGAFHLIKVREVYPGSTANPSSEFVELQMYADGQNLVTGHAVELYSQGGAETMSAVFLGPVASGGNQRSVLVATAAAETQFGVDADLLLPGSAIDPGGGAACWNDDPLTNAGIDCVSWGGFSGFGQLPSVPSPYVPPYTLPDVDPYPDPGPSPDPYPYAAQRASPTGTPAASIPNGSSLHRSIAAGCASWLEPGDDTDSSLADFSASAPSPRNNAAAPAEAPCAVAAGGNGGGGGSGGPGATGAPAVPAAARTKPRCAALRAKLKKAKGAKKKKLRRRLRALGC